MSNFFSQLPGGEFVALLTSLAVAIWELLCRGCDVAFTQVVQRAVTWCLAFVPVGLAKAASPVLDFNPPESAEQAISAAASAHHAASSAPGLRQRKTVWAITFKITRITILPVLIIALFLAGDGVVLTSQLWRVTGRHHALAGRVFQDFIPSRENVNPVSHIWSDVFHSHSVVVQVVREDNGHAQQDVFLRCLLSRGAKPGGWPVSIAIRARNEGALAVAPQYRSLLVRLRVPITSRAGAEAKCFSVRVRDRRSTYWKYVVTPGTYEQMELTADGQWYEFRIRLDDPSRWEVFLPDGNSAYAGSTPDFSMITDVVFELGEQGPDRPSPSDGTIDIAPVFLDEG